MNVGMTGAIDDRKNMGALVWTRSLFQGLDISNTMATNLTPKKPPWLVSKPVTIEFVTDKIETLQHVHED